MIACVADLFVTLPPPTLQTQAPIPVATVVEVTVGTAVAAASVLPVFMGFASPAQRGAAARVVAKQLLSVLICGALLALGNYIFTMCTKQWAEAGLPVDLPTIAKGPGGVAPPPAGQTIAGGTVRSTTGQTSSAPQNAWTQQYMD